jgi:outer membrane protein
MTVVAQEFAAINDLATQTQFLQTIISVKHQRIYAHAHGCAYQQAGTAAIEPWVSLAEEQNPYVVTAPVRGVGFQARYRS